MSTPDHKASTCDIQSPMPIQDFSVLTLDVPAAPPSTISEATLCEGYLARLHAADAAHLAQFLEKINYKVRIPNKTESRF